MRKVIIILITFLPNPFLCIVAVGKNKMSLCFDKLNMTENTRAVG